MSKVLLIAGRGNTNAIKDVMKSHTLYDETLSEILPEEKNIIIKPDLESFKNIFKTNIEENSKDFIKWFRKLQDNDVLEKIKPTLNQLLALLPNNHTISSHFHREFISFIDDLEQVDARFKFLKKKYPGPTETLPEHLKAVIINDINQIVDYPDTIKGFINKGVPVIFISNRRVKKVNDIEFYKHLFNDNPNYYRINWNKKKIKSLTTTSFSNNQYLDQKLWTICKRYVDQKVNIQIFDKNELDIIIPELQKQISSLDDFEILQKAFYRYLYPALYSLKNSITTNSFVTDLILKFKEVFDEVKEFGINENIKETIDRVIDIALGFKHNTKSFSFEENIFSTILFKNEGENLFIPTESKRSLLPTSEVDSITFTGYPYLEYSSQYLLNAINNKFIPNIKILCWPHEGALTYSYLNRRFIAGYFTDNVPKKNLIPDNLLLKNEDDIKKEIDNFFPQIDNGTFKDEESLERLHSYKYKGYSTNKETDSVFKVQCDIINFDDGCFMFLPKGGKILSETESSYGEIGIKNLKIKELTVGYKVFKYKKDIAAYREISKRNNDVKAAFLTLNLWRNALKKVYLSSQESIKKLEELLIQKKQELEIKGGNPSQINIQRWLFDTELVSPDIKNLRIILYAADVDDTENKLKELQVAYKTVAANTIHLSAIIKKKIARQLSEQHTDNELFSISIKGTQIEVETRIISAIERSDIEVDYHNIRKVLC